MFRLFYFFRFLAQSAMHTAHQSLQVLTNTRNFGDHMPSVKNLLRLNSSLFIVPSTTKQIYKNESHVMWAMQHYGIFFFQLYMCTLGIRQISKHKNKQTAVDRLNVEQQRQWMCHYQGTQHPDKMLGNICLPKINVTYGIKSYVQK